MNCPMSEIVLTYGITGTSVLTAQGTWSLFYVHGSVRCESLSIIVQRDAAIYSFIIFLQTALHVSGDALIHHQEHTQNSNYNI